MKPSPCPTPVLSTTVPFAPIDLEHGMEQFSQVPPHCNEAEPQLLLHQEGLMSDAMHLMETRETRITRGACILLSVVLFLAAKNVERTDNSGEQAALSAGDENKHGEYLYPTSLLFFAPSASSAAMRTKIKLNETKWHVDEGKTMSHVHTNQSSCASAGQPDTAANHTSQSLHI